MNDHVQSYAFILLETERTAVVISEFRIAAQRK